MNELEKIRKLDDEELKVFIDFVVKEAHKELQKKYNKCSTLKGFVNVRNDINEKLKDE